MLNENTNKWNYLLHDVFMIIVSNLMESHHGIHTLIKYRRQVHSRLSLWFYFRFFFTFFRNDFFYDHCQTN